MVIGLVQDSIRMLNREYNNLSVDVRYFVDGAFFRGGLQNGELDFCILVDGYQEYFAFEPIMKQRFYAVMLKEHELAKNTDVSFQSIMEYSQIVTTFANTL